MISLFKGPAHSKNKNLYFSASAQTKRIQPILVSCEALFAKNTGPGLTALPYYPHIGWLIGWLVGRSVRHNYLKWQESCGQTEHNFHLQL